MSIAIVKDLKCDNSKNNSWLFEKQKRSTRTNTIILINVPEHAQQVQGSCRFLMFIFSAGMLVSVVATPLGCLKSKFTTWTYRNSTAFDRSSGTEQLHCSNSGETSCAAIAVSRTDSIALIGTAVPSILSQTNPVYLPLL